MKARERIVLTGTLTVLLLSWLGFLVHSSPRFAGSGLGAVFGIAAAVLMLFPLAYPIVTNSRCARTSYSSAGSLGRSSCTSFCRYSSMCC